ncbi:MAG: hypothetical protein ACJ798_09605 [Phenylobacterium sp.]
MLAACQRSPKADPGLVSANRAVFDQVRTGQVDAVLAQIPPGPNRDATAEVVGKIRGLLPPTPPRSATVVAQKSAASPKLHIEDLIVEYDYPDRAARFETTFEQPVGGQGWTLRMLRLAVATHQELALNTLSLGHRSPGQIVFFALAVASPIVMVAALIRVLRTPGLTYRWLWGALAFIGLFSFQMNWATGAMLIEWTSLQIFGFWLVKGPSQYEPWMIGATVPIGAMLILSGLVARPPRKA